MQMLARNPAAAYRRVELDARIEASSAADLTRICLEEAVAGLSAAKAAAERGLPVPRPALVRAQSILLWLARSVAPEHPMRESLVTFYGGLAAQIGANFQQANAGALEAIRNDISDLLAAAGRDA